MNKGTIFVFLPTWFSTLVDVTIVYIFFYLLENSIFFSCVLCLFPSFFFFFFFENQSLHNSPGFYLFLGFSWNFFGFSWSVQFCAVLNLVNLIFAIIFSHNSVIRHNTYWCQFFFSEIKFPSAWLLSHLSSCLLFFLLFYSSNCFT